MFERKNSKAAKLTPEDVRAIRKYYAEGATQGDLCRHFGVSVGQIGRIVRGESWSGKAADGMKTAAEAERSLARVQAMLSDQPPAVMAQTARVVAPPPSPLDGADAPSEVDGSALATLESRAQAFGLDIEKLRGGV